MSAYLDGAKKQVKSLKIQNFDQTSEKRTILTRPVGLHNSEAWHYKQAKTKMNLTICINEINNMYFWWWLIGGLLQTPSLKKHGRLFGTQEYYLIIQFPADSKLSGNSS